MQTEGGSTGSAELQLGYRTFSEAKGCAVEVDV